MKIAAIIIIAAVTFGVCFLVDKGFTKLFRNREQHKSGLAVKLNKRYATIGLILAFLGTAAIFTGLKEGKALLIGGIAVVLMGIGLIVYYLTFGVYYDDNSFILASFGKKSETYSFRDIKEQRLYTVTGGSSIVELHLTDGRALSLHSTMEGTYPFLDHAFSAWCRQTGRNPEECTFHDPSQSCWFPNMETE
jgi:hypothetical protein